MTREEIIAKTNDVFAESFEIEPERLKPTSARPADEPAS